MHPYIQPLKKQLILHQDMERATGAKAYMRNQFEYFGMEAKLWRQITKNAYQNKPCLSKTICD